MMDGKTSETCRAFYKNNNLRNRCILLVILSCFFLSCKANARVKLAKTGHSPHSSTLVVIGVVRLLFVLFYVLFVYICVLPPGDNPIAVNKYIKGTQCT